MSLGVAACPPSYCPENNSRHGVPEEHQRLACLRDQVPPGRTRERHAGTMKDWGNALTHVARARPPSEVEDLLLPAAKTLLPPLGYSKSSSSLLSRAPR